MMLALGRVGRWESGKVGEWESGYQKSEFFGVRNFPNRKLWERLRFANESDLAVEGYQR